MKYFIIKISLVISITILINLIVGLFRIYRNEKIPYILNIENQYITGSKIENSNKIISYMPTGDLDHELIYKTDTIFRKNDNFGFSNFVENKNPEILFLGDSFFNDPHINTQNGLQSQTNKLFNKNISYNIGAPGCSGFRVFNELKNCFFKTIPKLIVLEIVERNINGIVNMPLEIKNNTKKTKKYNYLYLDLLLGNNFTNIKKQKINNKPCININKNRVYFLKGKTSIYNDNEIKEIIQSMKDIELLLQKQRIKILFVIAPDKESFYPEIFGHSSIEKLQTQMKLNNIMFVDIYSKIKNDKKEFYYNGDTHWNINAINTLVESVYDFYIKSF